jgi:hypothetical protein
MSVVASPAFTVPRKYRLANLAMLLLLYLGLLSFAAVNSMKVECGPAYLTLDGEILMLDGKRLTLDGERECHVNASGVRVPLPWWVAPFGGQS